MLTGGLSSLTCTALPNSTCCALLCDKPGDKIALSLGLSSSVTLLLTYIINKWNKSPNATQEFKLKYVQDHHSLRGLSFLEIIKEYVLFNLA